MRLQRMTAADDCAAHDFVACGLQLKLAVLRVVTPAQFARAFMETYPCCVDVLSLLKCAHLYIRPFHVHIASCSCCHDLRRTHRPEFVLCHVLMVLMLKPSSCTYASCSVAHA